MSDQVSQNIDSITSLSSDLAKFDHESILAEIKTIRANANKGVLIANDSEQYSRRNSLRIRGLSCEGTSTMSAVVNFLETKLDMKVISPEDIVAAHLLPVNQRSSTSGPQIPTILLKFWNRQLRDNVIRKRKLLRGSDYSVDEDLTALNIQLVNKLRLGTEKFMQHWIIIKRWSRSRWVRSKNSSVFLLWEINQVDCINVFTMHSVFFSCWPTLPLLFIAFENWSLYYAFLFALDLFFICCALLHSPYPKSNEHVYTI